jgi:hypothetical protein
MARRIVDRLTRALRANDITTEHVHFHAGPAGQPYACHDVRCQSPALDLDRR